MNPLTRTYKCGMHLFHENDRSRELYVVQCGKVKVYKMIGTREIELAVMGKGAVLGEMALIDGKPRSASAKVLEECTVVQIDSEAIYNKIKGVPPWFLSMIRLTSQKIRRTNIRVHSISPERHGAALILSLGYLFKKEDNRPLAIAETELKLIQLLGSNYLKTASALELLNKWKLIEMDNVHIRLLQPDSFIEYCRYLRLMLRGCYKDYSSLNPGLFRLAQAVSDIFPSILQNEDALFQIKGEHLWSLYLHSDLRDFHEIVTEFLMDEGSLAFEKKFSRCQIAHPFSRSVLNLINPGWMKLALYNKYKDLNPSI